jgi:hypothetical protein
MIATVENTVTQHEEPQSLAQTTPPSAAAPSAAALCAAAKRPPSVRDFAVYQFIKFECNSTREAAREFRISPTRVRQIIARVIEFLIEAPRRGIDEDPCDARLYVAEHLAYERLEYLYQRAIKAYDDTHGEDIHGNLMPGKACYLALAGRITMWMSKVPVHPLPTFYEVADQQDDDEFDSASERREFGGAEPSATPRPSVGVLRDSTPTPGRTLTTGQGFDRPRADNDDEDESASDKTPPVADCSPGVVSRGDLAAAPAAADDVTVPAEGTYKTLDEIKAEARRKFLRPAQPALSQMPDSPKGGESGVDAGVNQRLQAADPLYARTPLNRRQRRARDRRRKRLLGKR